MQRVLAIRTPDGLYLEFANVRAQLEDGSEISIELSEAVFAQIISVPDLPPQRSEPRQNGKGTIVVTGAGGIESQEIVKG